MNQTKTSKTRFTKASYYDRAILLQIRACAELENTPIDEIGITPRYINLLHNGETHRALHVSDTAVFADKKWRGTVVKSTWRTYRCSIIFYAEMMYDKLLITSLEVEKIKAVLEGCGGCKKSNKTSSQKKKSQQNTDHDLLMKHLSKSRSSFAPTLRLWMHVNRMVGLRPCEWKDASIEVIDKRVALVVNNAKNTNGRSHGVKRIIPIDHISKANITNIKIFAKNNSLLTDAEFKRVYEGCRKLLQRSSRSLWRKRDKHITLYSSRHQFSADLKSNGRTMKEIAYLMGHISTDTATYHYGKKRFGRSRRTPFVDPQNTEMIKADFKRFSFVKKLN